MSRRLRSWWSGAHAHLAWLAASGAGLAAGFVFDPYVFGIAALSCATLSVAWIALTTVFALRALPWALLAAAPSAIALFLLSGFRWG